MTKRMTAEEVETLCKIVKSKPTIANQYDLAANRIVDAVRDNLIPQWQDEPDEETHAACPWWWVENLGADSPPQKLRSYRPLKINPEDSTFSVSMNEPRKWDMWTVAGWIPHVGRVCPIGARPS